MPLSTHTARHLHWRSPAKVNLCLRIVGRRADGYHLLDSVFAPVDLCDDIAVTIDGVAPGAPLVVEVRCDRDDVPQDASNLAARAAAALFGELGLGATVRIEIAKVVPPGAGLGGGSGNAAAVLRGLAEALALGVTEARLAELALALGADVPFFLVGAAARVRGIGEDVEPIDGFGELALVIAIPPVAVSTAWAFHAFAALVPEPTADGDEAARLAGGAPPSPALLVNDLERVVLPAFPAIRQVKELLLAGGASAVVMSGSGSAVVGVVASIAEAERLAAQVRRARPEVQAYAVRTRGGVAGPVGSG